MQSTSMPVFGGEGRLPW